MPKDLKYYFDLAEDMVEANENLRIMQEGMDRLAHLEYRLPGPVEKLEWARKFISSSPYEAYRAATRTLASLLPHLQIETVSVANGTKQYDPTSQAAKDKANAWEKVLLWQFKLAVLRQGLLQSDIIASALRQDEICGQIVFLPEQIKGVEAMGGNANRYKAARRYGDFAFLIRDPKSVYARYSDLMLEAVLFTQVVKPQDLVDFWGPKADAIKADMENEDEDDCESYVLFEYTDYESIVTWAVPGDNVMDAVNYGEDDKNESEDDIVVLEKRDNPYPFLNGWVCVKGGTQLETDPEYQRQPMLWPVWKTQQWINANIMGTLMMSEAIAKAAAPSAAIEGPNPNSVQIEYGQPGQPVNIPTGHKYQQLIKEQLDPALKEGYDRLEATMQNATVARILTTADPVPNESFSGANLRYKTASDSLMPWRRLSERFLTEAFRTMMLWSHYTSTDLKGYSEANKDKGAVYQITSGEIDPECLYLETQLVPDVPTDRMQQINGAINMSRELRYPMARILQELNVDDPEVAIKEYFIEQFTWAAIQGKLKLIAAQASNEIDQMAAQKAQEMVAQQMKQAQDQAKAAQQGQPGGGGPPEAQGPAGAAGGMPPDLMGGMGMPGVGGMGMNPGMGGTPPAQANPMGNTAPGATGAAANGVPVQ